MRQISLSEPAWQTTLPHRIAPRPEEWFPGLLLRCDEANQWGTRTTLAYVLRGGSVKFHRCWRTDTPNLTVVLPSSLDLGYLAQLLAVPIQSIIDTTYQAEIVRVVGKCRLHPNYLAHVFSFQVCPACIAEDRMLRREVVLPYLQFCSKHKIAFVKICQCGSTLRLFKKHTQPFRCYQCGLDWSDLPRVEASFEEAVLNQQFLDWYTFFFSHANLNIIRRVLEFINTQPLKRKLIYQDDLSLLKRPHYQSKKPWNWKSSPGLPPFNVIDIFPFPPPLSIVAALLVERDLFLEEDIISRLKPRAISSTEICYRFFGRGRKYEPYFDLADVINSPNPVACLMSSPTIPLTIDQFPHGSLVLSIQALADQFYRLADEDTRSCFEYRLSPLLIIALFAKLAGANRVEALADWYRLKSRYFNGLMAFACNTEPYSQIGNPIFTQAIDLQTLNTVLETFFQHEELTTSVPPRGTIMLVLHGTDLRGTIPRPKREGMDLVVVYLPEQGVVLAQVEVKEKANEIVVVPPSVAVVDLRGIVVTGDVMRAEPRLSTRIMEAGGDYLWYANTNTPEFYHDIKKVFPPLPALSGAVESLSNIGIAQQVEKGNGWLEVWRMTVRDELPNYDAWTHLAQVFKLEQWVINGVAQPTYNVRYGITSLPTSVADAKQLLLLVRRG